jgi:Predicted hydrolases or acyltransferases (alpha/beta hydrolase superfamily)
MDDFTIDAFSENIDPGQVQYFELAPDMRIAYEVRGSSGPIVILLHGFGASRESWYDIAPLLQLHMQLYLVDLLGFGLSSKPSRADYSVAMQATVVAKFISALKLRRVTLVGHSYGGGVALRTLLDHEELPVNRLVLIDAAGYEQPLPLFVGTLRKPILNRIVLRLPARTRARITLKHLFWNRDRVTAARVNRYAKYFDMPGAHASYIAAARHLIPTDHGEVISRIATINVPTLIIWGERDAAIKVSNADKFARDIKGSRLIVLPRCGHIPHEEWPVETALAMQEFVAVTHE